MIIARLNETFIFLVFDLVFQLTNHKFCENIVELFIKIYYNDVNAELAQLVEQRPRNA